MAFPFLVEGEGHTHPFPPPERFVRMCNCAKGAIECMVRPGVADLYCNQSLDCCTPGDTTLKDLIDAGIVANPALGTAEDRALIAKYEAAIEIAHQRLGNFVCMSKYAGDCILVISVCVEEACCRCANPCSTNCERITVALPELEEWIDPTRIGSVTIDGESFRVNDEPAVEDGWMLTSHDGWLLSGPLVEAGGKFEIAIVASALRIEWLEAIKSLACNLVPGSHSEGCSSENPEFAPPPGFLNNQIGDTLDKTCCMPSLRFGSMGTNVRAIRWADAAFTLPGGGTATSGTLETETIISTIPANTPMTFVFATLASIADVEVTDQNGNEILLQIQHAGNTAVVTSNNEIVNAQIKATGVAV